MTPISRDDQLEILFSIFVVSTIINRSRWQKIYGKIVNIFISTCLPLERSGSVVECLTQDFKQGTLILA